MTTPNHDNPPRTPASLHELDAQAVDHLLDGGPVGDVPADRLRQAQALGKLMDQWQAGSAPLDLKNRTLAKVKQARDAEKRRTEPLRLPFSPGKLTEVAAVAAMVLIAFSLAVPMLVRARDHERRVLCQSNLRQTGEAFGNYAADFAGVMPRHHTVPSDPWWRVGQAVVKGQPVQSNASNLYLLARQGYVSAQTLSCPDNADAPRKMSLTAQDWPDAQAVSYSYQTQFTPQPYNLSAARDMVVLADRNPLFEVGAPPGIAPGTSRGGLTFRKDLPVTAATRFHRQQGQNVLDATGQAGWKADPVMPRNNDNIWLINNVTEYRGHETPDDPADTFLAP